MMMRQRKVWILPICIAIFVSQTVACAPVLSNEEKKKTVYKMYQDYKNKDFPDVKDISPLEAMALLPSGDIVFVDTRKTTEMQVSMLPGAVTREAFMKEKDNYEGKTIVAYCTISFRSGVFAKEMAARDVTILNLKGGILAWVLEEGRVFDDQGETRKIHVYGSKWNHVPAGYESIEF